jgi:hypothetical protein
MTVADLIDRKTTLIDLTSTDSAQAAKHNQAFAAKGPQGKRASREIQTSQIS